MDRARRIGGLVWVGAGLVFSLGWAVLAGVAPGSVIAVIVVAAVALALVVVAPRSSPTARWLVGWVVAVLLAAEFAGAVADRFGAFGPPGAPGVSWGDWTAFVDDTAVLLHDPAQPLVAVAAVGATAAEVLLAVALVSGWQRRLVGKAAAAMLAVYLIAMATSVGWDDVATYALPVQIGAALLVTVCPAHRTARGAADSGPRPRTASAP